MTESTSTGVESLIAFTTHVKAILEKATNEQPEVLPDVTLYTDTLPLSPKELTKSQKSILREQAVGFWNRCDVIIDASSSKSTHIQIVKLRAFAYLLLASIVHSKSQRHSTLEKLFDCATTAAKECLRVDLLDLASRMLENAARIEATHRVSHVDLLNSCLNPVSVLEYHSLRLLLHWKRQRGDLADRSFDQLSLLMNDVQDSDMEDTVGLLHGIGEDCMARGDHVNAVKWLDRVRDILDKEAYAAYFASSDLRLNVLHSLARALSESRDLPSTERCHELLCQMRSEYGPKLPVLLLTLEVAFQAEEPDAGPICQTLEEIIRTSHLLESNHKAIMYFIHRLKEIDTAHALACFKHYLLHRLVPENNIDWVERAMITYLDMYMAQDSVNSAQGIKNLESDLDRFFASIGSPLSSIAAQAAHVLIWRIIRKTDTQGYRSLAMAWCQVALHALFESAGDATLGRLKRQLISFHMSTSSHSKAYELLEEMSFAQKNSMHSKYLAYCLAVRSDNQPRADSCLYTIMNAHGEIDKVLFACIGESIQYGKPVHTARLLHRVLDKQMRAPSKEVDLGVLLKYTAKTWLQIVCDRSLMQHPDDDVLIRLCSVFRHAVRLRQNRHDGQQNRHSCSDFDASWFGEQSFAVAKQHVKAWPKRYLIDLFHYSTQLCGPPDDVAVELITSKCSRAQLWEATFAEGLLYAAEAREANGAYTTEDLPRTSFDSQSKPSTSECRLVLHQKVYSIFTTLQEQFRSQILWSDEELADAKAQLHILIPLAFEALLFMNANSYLAQGTAFDELSIRQFLRWANELGAPASTCALLADTTLAFASGDDDVDEQRQLGGMQIPSISAARTLGQIVGTLRYAQEYNVEQAARWIRCVAQLVLEDVEKALRTVGIEAAKPEDEQSLNMLETVVTQAIELASTGNGQHESEASGDAVVVLASRSSYPPEELHWLAIKLFNLAIDLLAVQRPNLAKKWAKKAVEVAAVSPDGATGLAGLIQHRMAELGW